MSVAHAEIELNLERTSAVEARAISSTPLPQPADAGANIDPPWFLSPNINPIEWQAFASYRNPLSAHIVAGLLESEGVPTIISGWSAFPGAIPSVVWVPQQLMHRARWIAALEPPSDAELSFLATGELHSPPDEAV